MEFFPLRLGLALVLALSACAGEKQTGSPGPGPAEDLSRAAPPPGPDALPGMDETAPAGSGALGGSGVVHRSRADGGPGAPGEITLHLGPGDQVSGRVALGGRSYQVNGVRQGDQLRCWLTSAADQPKQRWRGMLLGQREEGRLSGTLTVSSSGGSEKDHRPWELELASRGE
jgi:hypothetical protein